MDQDQYLCEIPITYAKGIVVNKEQAFVPDHHDKDPFLCIYNKPQTDKRFLFLVTNNNIDKFDGILYKMPSDKYLQDKNSFELKKTILEEAERNEKMPLISKIGTVKDIALKYCQKYRL